MEKKFALLSTPAEKHADFNTLKIWDKSDRWLKSYGEEVQILAKTTFWSQLYKASSPIDPKF